MALKTNLVTHWSLEEASGSRADDIGGQTLTDNNTVTQATGKVANAALFTAANSESLSHTSNATLQMGDIDFTLACWIKLTSKTGTTAYLMGKFGTAPTREYSLRYTNADRFDMTISNDGTALVALVAATFGAPALATWYFVVCWHDSVANTLNIQVNNGTVDSVAHSAGVFASTTNFVIGARADAAGYIDGAIDEPAIWKRVLTAQERTDLYNSGNGLPFSQFSGTYTLSGSGTAQAATGSGAGLVNTAPVYSLSGAGTPANATGSGAGLVNTAPVYHLSGIGSAQDATGSGVGLVTTAPIYSLSGAGQADAATGSGAGLRWIPDVIPAKIFIANARPLTFRGVPQ